MSFIDRTAWFSSWIMTALRQFPLGYKLLLLQFQKQSRIWRNHVTQVWTISYTAVCRTSSCLKQQVAIFHPVNGAPELLETLSKMTPSTRRGGRFFQFISVAR